MLRIIDVQRTVLDAHYERLLEEAGSIGAAVFHGHADAGEARQTLAAQVRAHPVYYLYAAIEQEGEGRAASWSVVGYILWRIEGGSDRENLVVELDQLAIHPQHQGRGIGKQLIADSRAQLGGELAWRREERRRSGATSFPPLAGIRWVVWFYAENRRAQTLYEQFFRCEGGRRTYYGKPEVMLYEDTSAPQPIRLD